jgi:hypothetical protein
MNYKFYYYTFLIGADYKIINIWTKSDGYTVTQVRWVRFIKITPKGFNLLDLETNKCILRHHLYDRRYVGVKVPRRATIFKVRVPSWLPEPEIQLSEALDA